MPQELADIGDSGAGLRQVCRETVTEHMRANALFDDGQIVARDDLRASTFLNMAVKHRYRK